MRHVFALDLIDNPERIIEYENHHRAVWPEVEDSFRLAGITNVELYRTGNRLFMLLDVDETFSFERKQEIDDSDPVIRKWEMLMGSYQQPLPWAREGEKWILMSRIYAFENK